MQSVVAAVIFSIFVLLHVAYGLRCISHKNCGENAACITVNATDKAGKCMCFVGYHGNGLICVEDPNELNAVDRSIGLRRLSNGKLEKCSVEPRSTNQQQEKTPPPTITTSSLIHDASISKQSLVQERSVFDTLQEQVGDVKCPQINCNFEFGPCGYRNIADSKWIVVRGEYGPELFSRITKAAKGDGYAAIRGTGNSLALHVLVSEEANFLALTALAFNYHWSNPLTQLRVCLDGLDTCLWQADEQSQQADNWSLGLVTLPPGQHRVIFVADRLSRIDQIGIDNIRLVNSNAQLTDCF